MIIFPEVVFAVQLKCPIPYHGYDCHKAVLSYCLGQNLELVGWDSENGIKVIRDSKNCYWRCRRKEDGWRPRGKMSPIDVNACVKARSMGIKKGEEAWIKERSGWGNPRRLERDKKILEYEIRKKGR